MRPLSSDGRDSSGEGSASEHASMNLPGKRKEGEERREGGEKERGKREEGEGVGEEIRNEDEIEARVEG